MRIKLHYFIRVHKFCLEIIFKSLLKPSVRIQELKDTVARGKEGEGLVKGSGKNKMQLKYRSDQAGWGWNSYTATTASAGQPTPFPPPPKDAWANSDWAQHDAWAQGAPSS